MVITQRCPRCSKDLPAEAYPSDKWGKPGHYCRVCVVEYKREWRKWSKGQKTRAEHFEAIRRRCTRPGCDESPWSKGSPYCAVHRPQGLSSSYRAVHKRVAVVRGKACTHPCAHCPDQAEHWAYDHKDPDEVIGQTDRGVAVAYSLDPTHYLPLCRPCHVRLDNGDGNSFAYEGSALQALNNARRAAATMTTKTTQPKRISKW